MAVQYSEAVENALLDVVESGVGTSPRLILYSAAPPASTTDSDPSSALATFVLPGDWMQAALGEQKNQLGGPWQATVAVSGTALSFRLKNESETVCYLQGTVSAPGQGGDIQIRPNTLSAGAKVVVDSFSLRVATSLGAALTMQLSRTQAGHTLSSSISSYIPTDPGLRGSWQLLNIENNDPANPPYAVPMGGWANLAVDPVRDCAWMVNWYGRILRFELGTGEMSEEGLFEPTAGGGCHNRTLEYDPINDRLWFSNGTFGAYTRDCMTWYHLPTGTRGQASTQTIPSYQSAMEYHAPTQRMVAWGGWNGHNVLTWDLNPISSLWASAPTAGTRPPTVLEADKFTDYKTVWDSLRGRWITVATADANLYVLPADLSAWQTILTTGTTKPPISAWFVYDEKNDQIIGWVGTASTVVGQPVIGEPRTTWLLRLSDPAFEWVQAASSSFGDSVPPASSMIATAMVWDSARDRAFLVISRDPNPVDVWVYYPPAAGVSLTLTATQASNALSAYMYQPTGAVPPITGTIQRISLPVRDPAAPPGVNHNGLGFTAGGYTKHVEGAYCPTNNRVYFANGDIAYFGSAHDMTWSMNLSTGQWRFENGRPLDGYLAPMALQDGFGFHWMPSRNQFLIVPGIYFPYEGAPRELPLVNYSRGYWRYDPFNPDTVGQGTVSPLPVPPVGTYTQGLEFFGNYWNGSPPPTTGSDHGAWYDPVTDTFIALFNSSVARWSMATLTRLPDITLPTGSPPPGGYFRNISRTQAVGAGRWLYTVGFWNNGLNFIPGAWRYNMDTHAFEELAPPPIDAALTNTIRTTNAAKEIRLGHSNGKIVWPVIIDGADSPILMVLVYDIASNTWFRDTNYTDDLSANTVTTLVGDPEGRIAICGGRGGSALPAGLKYIALFKY